MTRRHGNSGAQAPEPHRPRAILALQRPSKTAHTAITNPSARDGEPGTGTTSSTTSSTTSARHPHYFRTTSVKATVAAPITATATATVNTSSPVSATTSTTTTATSPARAWTGHLASLAHTILNSDRHLSPTEAMDMALALSRQAIGLSDPNPRVGCVITDSQGRLLGAGHTQQAGGPHAEVMALRDAQARGHGAQALVGAHVYVTLEPCAHHGRTPPCCETLSAARVGRVHMALLDPNPLVAGKGRAHLEAAGIACDVGLGAEQAREINPGFLSRMVRGRPFVRMKIAASLDGRTALPDGRSQWITGPAAREDGQWWRQRAGAILTGVGTVLDDDPRLDLRLPTGGDPPLQPLRVIVDSRLRTPAAARILMPPGRVLLVHAGLAPPEATAWPAGVELLALPAHRADAQSWDVSQTQGARPHPETPVDPAAMPSRHTPVHGGVDLLALLHELGRRGVNELHVEAGATLNGALLAAGLVDELLVYFAPMLIGTGRGMVQLDPLPDLQAAPRFERIDLSALGDDVRMRLRRRDLGF